MWIVAAQLTFRPSSSSNSPRSAAGSQFWRSAPSAIGRDALIGYPHAFRQFASLPEHVDRDAAARIPVATDAKPFRLDLGCDPLADHDRAILVEGAMIAEACDVQFQRFGLQQPLARHIVD